MKFLSVKVGVSGAGGKMGREVVRALAKEEDLVLTAACDPAFFSEDAGLLAGLEKNNVIIDKNLKDAVRKADVWVDFTRPDMVKENIAISLDARKPIVVGTSGLSESYVSSLITNDIGVLVVPNFAIGAVLMMQFAKTAHKFFPNVEIIELHHDQKIDSPSGTAVKTAELLGASEIGKNEGPRGQNNDGMHIHSVRLPGLVAHQEVIFGGEGQLLTIRHDSFDRISFMPGVILAIREVLKLKGPIYGLEHVLGL